MALSRVSPPVGDGQSSASATASSGGLVAVNAGNTADVTITQSITAVSSANMNVGGNLAIIADSLTDASGYITNANGGLIAVKDSATTLTVANDSTASLGGVVVVEGDVAVVADSGNTLDAAAYAEGGGFVDIALAEATSTLTPNVTASILEDADIVAGGDVAVWADYRTDDGGADQSSPTSVVGLTQVSAGGLGADATGAGTAQIESSTTSVLVGMHATVEGETISLWAQPTNVTVDADTETVAGGLGVNNDSEADALITHDATVEVLESANVIGRRGVDIRATYNEVEINAFADGDTDAAFATTDVIATANTDVDAVVTTHDDALVTASPRSGETSLITESGYDRLALFVETSRTGATAEAAYSFSPAGLEFGNGGSAEFSHDGISTTTWDADVAIGSGPVPELVIDGSGNAETAIGVSHQVAGNQIIVDDIVGDVGGQVLMQSAVIDDSGDVNDNDLGASFHFLDTLGHVTIINDSTKELVIGNISLANGDNPWVDLQAPEVSLTFELQRTVGSSLVTIANRHPAAENDIILTGTIDNPIGETRITAQTGDIVSATERDQLLDSRTSLIRTGDLLLDAPQGSIGYDKDAAAGNTNHVNVDLVQSSLHDAQLRTRRNRCVHRSQGTAARSERRRRAGFQR